MCVKRLSAHKAGVTFVYVCGGENKTVLQFLNVGNPERYFISRRRF